MLRRSLGFFIFPLLALACGRDDTASAHPRNGSRSDDDGVPPRPSVVAPASQPYRVVSVTGGGAISGTVDLEGSPPVAEVVRPPADQRVCGTSIAPKNVTLSGTRVVGAIVWLTDIRTGKGFPLERRFELTNDGCILDPFVQVISTNSTLNITNDDRTLHTNRLINVGTGKLAAIAPFNDDGEVVPVDRLREPAEIEVVCEQHPWTHAWIAVLDHPYYAQTAANGTFNIPDIPPGKYHVRAWYPSLGYADDSVVVTAGQQANIAFRIRRAAAPTPAPAPPAAESTPTTVTPPASSTPASSTPTSSSTPSAPPPRQR
ncbi:MAG: carboxypeptidase regulatory-like domain-containing protein [Gemmatimonadaceae bacterium]